MDDGTDPHRATGPSSPRLFTDGGLTAQEVRDPGTWLPAEPSRESPEAPREPPRRAGQSCLGRRRPRRSRTRFQSRASSSADPDPPAFPMPVQYPDGSMGIPFTAGVSPYAETQGRRLPGTRSQASSSSATRSDHPRAEGRTRVRQSILYSDRPRHSRPRRLARAAEHIALSSSELSSPVTNLATFEALSLSDPPLSIPETAEEIRDDYDGLPGDVEQSVPCTYYKKGLSRSMVLSLGDSLLKTVSFEDQPKPDSDVDIEELLRRLKEYDAARPKSFWEAVAEAKANERATLAALAAKWRTERPREVPQQVSSVAAHPHFSMVQRAPRREASAEETFQTGNGWMNKEVMLCFKKYVERSPDLVGLVDYDLDELQHQCFNVESYDKVYHHYNFTVKMKMPNSVDWTVQLYFAEAKEIFMRKYYVCYPLKSNENGRCYACKNQGVEDLRHPAIDVFETGSCDSPASGLWYTDD